WKESFDALVHQMTQTIPPAGNAGLVPLEQLAPSVPGFRQLKVARIDRESSSVSSLVLEPADGHPLIVPLPGQFVVLRLRLGTAALPVLRSYSLSSLPSAERYRLTIKEEKGGIASTYVSTQLRVGDVLDVSAPRGAFVLQPSSLPAVFLSAGVGVTPVMAMLHTLAAKESQRRVWWIHGARNREDHTFAREASDLLSKLPNSQSYVQYSRPDVNDRMGVEYNAPGRLTPAVVKNLGIPRDSEFYLCGPPAFLREFVAGLASWGVPEARVHSEIFGSGNSLTPGIKDSPHIPHAVASGAGDGPKISFARAGLTVTWDPKFHSLLELAEACDVPVRWSCRTGVCHTCECGLISGSLLYDPAPLEPAAAGNMLTCCSRPKSDLVIDI
ncbi:MAG TPA: 2Fe-2S iron-sulfur cluster-binding protein, partial [Phycisphaerae bacterium]|nr:2Fe-2S iron-sulfur cluster-binding protein [Phycisphaerae bacterium]